MPLLRLIQLVAIVNGSSILLKYRSQSRRVACTGRNEREPRCGILVHEAVQSHGMAAVVGRDWCKRWSRDFRGWAIADAATFTPAQTASSAINISP